MWPGAQPRLKSWGDQALGPNTGAQGRAGCWVREGIAPSRCEGPGVLPRKIFENSDAKSCILVTISGFPRTWNFLPSITTAKKLGDQ